MHGYRTIHGCKAMHGCVRLIILFSPFLNYPSSLFMPGDQSTCTRVHGVPVKYCMYPSNNMCDEKISTKYGESENHTCYSHVIDNWTIQIWKNLYVNSPLLLRQFYIPYVRTYVMTVPKSQ